MVFRPERTWIYSWWIRMAVSEVPKRTGCFGPKNPEVYILEDRKWKCCLLFQNAKSLEIEAAYNFDIMTICASRMYWNRREREWDLPVVGNETRLPNSGTEAPFIVWNWPVDYFSRCTYGSRWPWVKMKSQMAKKSNFPILVNKLLLA